MILNTIIFADIAKREKDGVSWDVSVMKKLELV